MTDCGVLTNCDLPTHRDGSPRAPCYVYRKEPSSKYVKEQGNEPVLRTCILKPGHFESHEAEDGTHWGGAQFVKGQSYVFSDVTGEPTWRPAPKPKAPPKAKAPDTSNLENRIAELEAEISSLKETEKAASK